MEVERELLVEGQHAVRRVRSVIGRRHESDGRRPDRFVIPAPTDRLLRVPETAELLGCSVRKVNAMLATGELRRRKLGRATRIPLSSVMALVEGRTD